MRRDVAFFLPYFRMNKEERKQHPSTPMRHPRPAKRSLSTQGMWRLAIVGFTLLAYIPTLSTPFLFDDHTAIERNENLRRWSFQNLYNDFRPSPESPWGRSYYRPLQMISHRVDVTVWGMNPKGHHATNLILHLLAALLLFELVVWIGLSEWVAGGCAVLFGIHPIIVSELLMVSGRPEILSLVFSLLTVLLLTRSTPVIRIMGGICFLAGLLSKESALSVPFFVGLVIWIRGGETERRSALDDYSGGLRSLWISAL